MRWKIKFFTFYAKKSTCLQPQNKKHPHFLFRFIKASMREKIYLLTFSADLKALCTPKTFFWIPPHLYNGRKSRIWANMHSTFCTLVTSEQKSPSLIQRNSEALWPPKFLTFYKSFTNGEKHLSLSMPIRKHFERIFFCLFAFITAKEKSPSLYKGLQKHFDHLKIVLFTNCSHSNPHTIERR